MFSSSILGIAFDAAIQQLKEEEEEAAVKWSASRNPQRSNSSNTTTHRDDAVVAGDDANGTVAAPSSELTPEMLDNLFGLSLKANEDGQEGNNSNQISSSGYFTQKQESELWALFEQSMCDALATTRAGAATGSSKNEVIIKTNATDPLVASGSGKGDDGGDGLDDHDEGDDSAAVAATRCSSSDNTRFPMYREIHNEWTIVLKDPQVIVSGPVASSSDVAVRTSSSGAGRGGEDGAPGSVTNDPLAEFSQRTMDSSTNSRLGHHRQIECDYAVLHIKRINDQDQSGDAQQNKVAPKRRRRQ